MALKFKTIKAHEPVDVPGAVVPDLRAVIQALFPGVEATDAIQLHFNRAGATPTNPKGDGIQAQLRSVVELSEQELIDALAAGETPFIFEVTEE